ncbi:MAG: 5-formyltetrahydrofolate cyclo-ligase [bacterium]|nr:5-formyltetrahydrofolate cyclo-ligase [bacterium]
MHKSEIRIELSAWRKSLSWEDVIKRSQQIGVRLFSLSEFRFAKRILFYVSYDNEVYTHEMIKHALRYRKQIFVPISQVAPHTLLISELLDFDLDLAPATYGILEPKPDCVRLANPKELDIVIVPGIAFDIQGNRLGHGVGYYDNYLRYLSPTIKTIGLAFKEQLLSELPKTDNDVPVNKIITENKIYTCSPGSAK